MMSYLPLVQSSVMTAIGSMPHLSGACFQNASSPRYSGKAIALFTNGKT